MKREAKEHDASRASLQNSSGASIMDDVIISSFSVPALPLPFTSAT